MQKVICILSLLVLAASGCSVAKRSGKTSDFATSASVNIDDVRANNLTNNSFYIQRADVTLKQQDISARFMASIKFRRPDSLVINIRTRTGIEAGRGLITNDTLIINDRINKRIYTGSARAVEQKYGIHTSLICLIFGDVIIGERENNSDNKCNNGLLTKTYKVNDRLVHYDIDCSRKKLTRIHLDGDVTTGDLDIILSEMKEEGTVKYPGRIDISDDNGSFGLTIEIRKVESPWNGNIGFISNKGYKVVRIR